MIAPTHKNIKVEPRGLGREDAAAYIGISARKFDELVSDGRMPRPRRIDGRLVWDRRGLDAAFDELPVSGPGGTVLAPGLPGSPEFMAAYEAAVCAHAPARSPQRALFGSFAALVNAYYASPAFLRLAPTSKASYRYVLEPIIAKHGKRPADMPTNEAQKIIAAIGIDRPAMANLACSVLRKLYSFGRVAKLTSSDPTIGIEPMKTGTHHTWTDDEITAYEKRWTVGTRERLALALLLYTGQRVGDAVRITRGDIKAGVIRLTQQKTSAEVEIAVHSDLAAIVRATPSAGIYVITDSAGRPVVGDTLSGVIRRGADKAGLPRRCVAHGLRKALGRILAERGASAREIGAVLGHRTLQQVSLYTDAADRARLAGAAVAKLSRQPSRRGAKRTKADG